jgi:hypothetical protein
MKVSNTTRNIMDRLNLRLVCGGGDFARAYHLVDRNKVTGVSTGSFVRRREVSESAFLTSNPDANLTGILNEFGHERAVLVNFEYAMVRVFSAKHLIVLVRNYQNTL